MSLLKNAVVAIACAQLVACAHATQARDIADVESASVQPVQIEVLNDNTSEVTVFLMRGLQRQRLGTVISGETARFHVPGRVVLTSLELRIAVEPTDRSWISATEPFEAAPGDRTAFSVQPNQRLSRRPNR
jgi:hypothetical protein